jgi:hypothetical protein
MSSPNILSFGGVAVQSEDLESFYYIGGWYTPYAIHKFTPATNITRRLPVFLYPSHVVYSALVSSTAEGTLSFIFNGQSRDIIEFDTKTERSKVIGQLDFTDDVVLSVGGIPDGKESIWLFSSDYIRPQITVLHFNTTSRLISIPEGNFNASLPRLFVKPAMVFDGLVGYIIGGVGRLRNEDGSLPPTNGILR